MFNLVWLKPQPEPAALAFSSSEPGQSRCWAITNGLAWPGPNRFGLAWLMALGWAGHITTHIHLWHIDMIQDKWYAQLQLLYVILAWEQLLDGFFCCILWAPSAVQIYQVWLQYCWQCGFQKCLHTGQIHATGLHCCSLLHVLPVTSFWSNCW